MWRQDVVQILGDIRIYPDPDDGFIREPAIADFQAGTFDFTLITIHSIYGDRKAERRAEAELLDEVYAAGGRACCTRSSPNIWRPSCSSRAWLKQQLPGHFEEELRVYLKCGILAHGFVRLRCADCESLRGLRVPGRHCHRHRAQASSFSVGSKSRRWSASAGPEAPVVSSIST